MLFLCVLTDCLWRSYQTLRAFLLNARVYLSDASQTHWQSYNIAIAVYIFYNFYFVLRSNGTCMACTVCNCLKGNFFWSLCFSTKLKKNHKKTELHDDDVIQKKQQPKSCCLFAEREGRSPLYRNTSQHAVTLYYYNAPTSLLLHIIPYYFA